MVELPEVIKNAVLALTKLPGIGEKTAMRMVMNMTHWKAQELDLVGHSIVSLRNLKLCLECGMYSDQELCTICTDQYRREQKIICIV